MYIKATQSKMKVIFKCKLRLDLVVLENCARM